MGSSRSDESRDRLIAAGVAALGRLTPTDLLSAAGAKNIAADAGLGVTTLYHHFGSLESFAEAVVAAVYDPATFDAQRITRTLAELSRDAFPVEFGLDGHRREFHRLLEDSLFRTRIGLWALGGPTVDDTYASFLSTIDEQYVILLTATFRAWGCELRPPLDMASFVALEVALLVGSVMRGIVDPEVMTEAEFSLTALGLLVSSLRPIGDPYELADRLAEINYYPLRSNEHADGNSDDPTRTRIIDAAEQILMAAPISPLTIGQITKRAEVSSSTVYRLFDGIDEIVVAVLQRRFVRDHGPAADVTDDDLRRSGMVDLMDHLAASRMMLSIYVRHLSTAHDVDDDPIIDIVARTIGVDTEESAVITLVAARELVRHPSAGGSGAVRHLEACGLLPSSGTGH